MGVFMKVVTMVVKRVLVILGTICFIGIIMFGSHIIISRYFVRGGAKHIINKTSGTTFDPSRPHDLIQAFSTKARGDDNLLYDVTLYVYGDTTEKSDLAWEQPGYELPSSAAFHISVNSIKDMELKIGDREVTGLAVSASPSASAKNQKLDSLRY
jgi:hypothetical protein